ncbi:sulfatase-like hydrolase/transferase [Paenibacillus koleovorans]|uniref:sulfatase-like hydrolase/transferase n=1 Tax=Paenibacillus koleovorans TaxID=121608 RepID=UPI0013E3AE4F|nr:sulfatase-like hydrolase/transferase [Paenibacillus koleovorans]
MKNQTRPNLLIFMPDQMQAQVTSPGHPCQTPNMDKIKEDGVSFPFTYPPMAHCCPARASFMTSLYPSQHGIYNNVSNDQAIHSQLNTGIETFSEKLAESGYQMYYAGKWHVSATETPQSRGWTELYLKEQELDQGKRRQAYREMNCESGQRGRKRGEILRPGWGGYTLYGTSDKSYTELNDYECVHEAISQLDRLQDSVDPWCMYIGPNGPHDPFVIPEKYANMYDPDLIQLPPNYYDDMQDKPRIYRRMRKVFSQLSEQEVKESIAHYWGYCTLIDDLFGEVLVTLERNRQMDNTLIIVVSDHGEHAGAHGLFCKGISMFDEGYRVPLIMSSPQLVKNPGRAVEQFVTLMDIAPTLIELTGAEPLGRSSGRSLVPFLSDETPDNWRDSIYAQCNGTELYYTSRMVKTKKFKFVYNPTDFDELYDLESDPYEMHNIADRPESKAVMKEMYSKMWEHAFEAEDMNFVQYIPVTTGEYGPAIVNAKERLI